MREILALIERKTGVIIGAGAGSLATVQWAPAIETGSKAALALCTALLAGTALVQKWRGRSRGKSTGTRPSELLMIDDSEDDCDLFARAFRRYHCNVTCVSTGAKALELLRSRQTFDWVLLDAKIPGENVVDTFRRVRDERPKLGVALFSGALEASTIEAISSLGFAIFIKKPSSGLGAFVDDLVSTLRIRSAPR